MLLYSKDKIYTLSCVYIYTIECQLWYVRLITQDCTTHHLFVGSMTGFIKQRSRWIIHWSSFINLEGQVGRQFLSFIT